MNTNLNKPPLHKNILDLDGDLMLEQLGKQIRELRKRKGTSLNEFAKELDISSGYLSNLETGKSDTIKLSVLEKLQKELNLLPLSSTSYLSPRLQQLEQKLINLENKDPRAAGYLLKNLEDGIEWFNSDKQ